MVYWSGIATLHAVLRPKEPCNQETYPPQSPFAPAFLYHPPSSHSSWWSTLPYGLVSMPMYSTKIGATLYPISCSHPQLSQGLGSKEASVSLIRHMGVRYLLPSRYSHVIIGKFPGAFVDSYFQKERREFASIIMGYPQYYKLPLSQSNYMITRRSNGALSRL